MNPVLSHPAVARLRSSAPIREALKAVLDLPEVKQALEAIDAATRPAAIPPPVPGNHPDTSIAHEFYRLIGIGNAVSAFRALATPVGSHEQEASIEGTEFTHALPPELRTKKP